MRVDEPRRRWPGGLRAVIVALLVAAAFFCTFAIPFGPSFFGRAYGLPGLVGPYWGQLLAGIACLAAAVFVARTARRF